jgi:cell wall-associated NlpC family hydrolase
MPSSKKQSAKNQFLSNIKKWEGTPFHAGAHNPALQKATTCTGFIGLELCRALGKKYIPPKVIAGWHPKFVEIFSLEMKKHDIPHEIIRFQTPPSLQDLQEGDIVFIRVKKLLRHTGVYLGKGKIIHARGDRVVIEDIHHLVKAIGAVIRVKWTEEED